jgi:hypothetical protein
LRKAYGVKSALQLFNARDLFSDDFNLIVQVSELFQNPTRCYAQVLSEEIVKNARNLHSDLHPSPP